MELRAAILVMGHNNGDDDCVEDEDDDWKTSGVGRAIAEDIANAKTI